jgi:Polyketide cyclase / dehydrase and lipid transport
MAVFEATIGSDWTADDTFSYLAVFSNAEQWDPGVLEGEQLDPGPVRVGSRFRLVVPFLGRKLALVYRVSEFSAGDRRVVLDAASTLLRARDRIAVLPGSAGVGAGAGPGTVVSYQAEVTLAGPLRLLDPVLSRGFRAVGERAAAGLASALTATSSTAARTR